MPNFTSAPARTSPPSRIAYAKTIFVPKAVQPGQDPRYSVRVMFEKNNPAQMEFLKTLAADFNDVLVQHWPDPATRPRIAFYGNTYLNILKDGDTAVNKNQVPYKEKDPELAGCFFLSAASKNKPAVVDQNNQPVIDSNMVYSGCYCEISLNVYAYTNEQSGVTIGLNGLRFARDGDRLGGGAPSVDEMFGSPANPGADDPANYGQTPNPFGQPAVPAPAPTPFGQHASPFGQPAGPAPAPTPFGQPAGPAPTPAPGIPF